MKRRWATCRIHYWSVEPCFHCLAGASDKLREVPARKGSRCGRARLTSKAPNHGSEPDRASAVKQTTEGNDGA